MSLLEQSPQLFKEFDEFYIFCVNNGIICKMEKENTPHGTIHDIQIQLGDYLSTAIQTPNKATALKWCEDTAITIYTIYNTYMSKEEQSVVDELRIVMIASQERVSVIKQTTAPIIDSDIKHTEGVIFNEEQKTILAEIARPCGGRHTRIRHNRIGSGGSIQV